MPYNNQSDLIAACLSGNASPEDEKALMAWRKASDANEQVFMEAMKAWELSGSLAEPGADFDSQEAWLHVKNSIDGQAKMPVKLRASGQWLMMAAGIVCVIAISITTRLFFKTEEGTPVHADVLKPKPAGPIAMVQVAARDSARVLFLPDSSKVYLGRHSTLSYPGTFGDSARHAVLKGEAFFEIRRDTLHPFSVTAAGTRVQVLGTSFDVKEDAQGKVSVIVVSGVVKFFPEGQPKKARVLRAGDKGTFNKAKGEISKTKNTDRDFKWWSKHKKENIIKRAIKTIRKKLN